MTQIAIDTGWAGRPLHPIVAQLVQRLRVLVRARRLARRRARRLRLVWTEMRDPRWVADAGVDYRSLRRSDWIGQMARSMGGRL